jgi:hypothetical protein
VEGGGASQKGGQLGGKRTREEGVEDSKERKMEAIEEQRALKRDVTRACISLRELVRTDANTSSCTYGLAPPQLEHAIPSSTFYAQLLSLPY